MTLGISENNVTELTREKVIQAVEQTGFPLELRTTDILSQRGYYVANSLYYVDKDEEKGREIDLRALLNRNATVEGNYYFVRHCLLIECKRYKKRPWVIFSNSQNIYDGFLNQLDVRGIPNDKITREMSEAVAPTHPLFNIQRIGRGYTELFSDDQTSSAASSIYGALTTVTKATIATRERSFGSGSGSICFYYPIVVLDGTLWSSFLHEGRIDAAETDSAVVRFSYESPNYPNQGFRIAIVTESGLPEYLNKLERSLDLMSEYIFGNPNYFFKNHKKA